MSNDEDIDKLRARLAELETENTQLRAEVPKSSSGGRGRSIVSCILLVLSVLIAPLAVVGTWARAELVDTDRFVSTFAPIVDEPQVQELITEQVSTAIDENLDIDQLISDVFDGIDQLGLPPAASTALGTLEGPAANGIRSLINTAVEKVVASEAFSTIWNTALRESHSRAIAIIQGEEGTAVTLGDDGTLSIQLSVVIAKVKDYLLDQGYGFASAIPEIDRTIPLASSDSLPTVRTAYNMADTVGYWLPWIVLGFAALGIFLARKRTAALVRTAFGYLAMLLLLALGLIIGRHFFLGSLDPSRVPRDTGQVIFAQVISDLRSAIGALIVLAICLIVGAWFASGTKSAITVRRASNSTFGLVRKAADEYGLSTQKFGRFLDQWHSAILLVIVVVAVLVVFANRPVSTGLVISALIWVVIALILLELLRRTEAEESARLARVEVAAAEAGTAATVDGDDALVGAGPDDDATTKPIDLPKQP